jgi:hypothetical protein
VNSRWRGSRPISTFEVPRLSLRESIIPHNHSSVLQTDFWHAEADVPIFGEQSQVYRLHLYILEETADLTASLAE